MAHSAPEAYFKSETHLYPAWNSPRVRRSARPRPPARRPAAAARCPGPRPGARWRLRRMRARGPAPPPRLLAAAPAPEYWPLSGAVTIVQVIPGGTCDRCPGRQTRIVVQSVTAMPLPELLDSALHRLPQLPRPAKQSAGTRSPCPHRCTRQLRSHRAAALQAEHCGAQQRARGRLQRRSSLRRRRVHRPAWGRRGRRQRGLDGRHGCRQRSRQRPLHLRPPHALSPLLAAVYAWQPGARRNAGALRRTPDVPDSLRGLSSSRDKSMRHSPASSVASKAFEPSWRNTSSGSQMLWQAKAAGQRTSAAQGALCPPCVLFPTKYAAICSRARLGHAQAAGQRAAAAAARADARGALQHAAQVGGSGRRSRRAAAALSLAQRPHLAPHRPQSVRGVAASPLLSGLHFASMHPRSATARDPEVLPSVLCSGGRVRGCSRAHLHRGPTLDVSRQVALYSNKCRAARRPAAPRS